ncbi:GNVR domain-containing protein, partial [Candidatus Eisenbacteria bacterium]
QARALVQSVAAVEGERLAALVELDAVLAHTGRSHPEAQRLTAQVQSLQRAKALLEGQLSQEENQGEFDTDLWGSPASKRKPTALIDLKTLPAVSLTYLRLYREVQIQEIVFELLTQIEEQYRIQEVRDTPTVQVLDPPSVPQEKAKPHRAVICIIATLLAFLLSLALVACLERIVILAETDPERHAKLTRLLSGIGLRFLLPRG